MKIKMKKNHKNCGNVICHFDRSSDVSERSVGAKRKPSNLQNFVSLKTKLEGGEIVKKHFSPKNNGSLMAETMIALALLGTIMICMALGLKTFGNFNQYLFAKQRCIAAAQAQLDSVSATGAPISDDVNKRLWPKVKIQIEESPGSGQWQGLKLVTVKAIEQSGTKKAHIEMARYFAGSKN